MRHALAGSNQKIFIKSFLGATVDCMNSYVIPSQKYKSDLYILHTGCNDLRSNKSPQVIAIEIIEDLSIVSR